MILFIVLLSGKKITLKVFGNDTVLSIKQKIQDSEGMLLNLQKLIYLTKEPKNEDTLDTLSFQSEGTMFLFSRLILSVDLVKGKKFPLIVSEDDTVEGVKQKILELEGIIWLQKAKIVFLLIAHSVTYSIGIPVEEQILKSKTKELNDGQKKLHEYNVQNNETMYLALKAYGG
ncbi:5800_t:CDS:2 [Dentiscutata heterogama]|uniref:5800_t:CDS:1 n=1 Tax=Dentiscutata heterogama TaxID=1316150 RepID=A0ACA9JZF6_9GLOM|nr:5800_t:CDS:2 [Dentiscutata heterogama]